MSSATLTGGGTADYLPGAGEFRKKDGAAHMARLRRAFHDHFGSLRYVERPGMRVTDAKLVDPTTRFIGSHTSVLKPDIYAGTVQAEGIRIVQTCLQAQNLELFKDSAAEIHNCSVFECHGLLAPYDALERVTRDVLAYFSGVLGIGDRMRYQVNSLDRDLVRTAWTVLPSQCVEIDAVPLEKTRHQFGDSRLAGRDIRITMGGDSCFVPCAVIVAMSLDGEPSYVEVTIAPGRILQQYHHLGHYMETFPFPDWPVGSRNWTRKIEDCSVSLILLCREGLKPGGSENKRKLMRKYLNSLEYIRARLGIRYDMLERILKEYEKAQYGETTEASRIIEYLAGARSTGERAAAEEAAIGQSWAGGLE